MGRLVFAFALLMLIPAAASAQAPDDCANDKAPADQRIVSCKAILQGNLSTAQREDDQISLGMAYQSARDFSDAQQIYAQILQSDPNAWRVYLQRAQLFWAQGQSDAEFADFASAIRLHPSLETYSSCAAAYLAAGKYDLAIADANAGLTFSPDDGMSFLTRAEAEDNLLQHDRAVADYAQALKADTAHTLPPFVRGAAEAEAGTPAAALADFSAALKLSPRDARIYYNRSALYARQKQYPEAISDLTTAIQLSPIFERAIRARAAVYFLMLDYPNSIADFTTAIALDPGNEQLLRVREQAFGQSGDYAHAIADDTAAEKLKPDDDQIYADRCWWRAVAGVDLTLAMSDCSHLLAKNPKFANVLDSEGLVLFRQNQLQQAMDSYNKALAVNPNLASSLYMRGVIEKKLKQDDASARDVAAAQAIDPKVAKLYSSLGLAP
jgi:tetratricopeptide (TPR) repeat protein